MCKSQILYSKTCWAVLQKLLLFYFYSPISSYEDMFCTTGT